MKQRSRGFCDFAVRYDPAKDKPIDLTKRILYSIFIKPIKAKKPRVAFVSGDSGEGKTLSSVSLQVMLCQIQGIDPRPMIEHMNVFTPLEYPHKLRNILHNKELKKLNIFCMHEARDIIRNTDWNNFVTQAVADINAQARAIKRLITFIISQFIRDITKDVRYTLNYYIKVSRPLHKKARLYIYVMWKDDRDLEKPKLRKRKLQGYLVNSKGKRTRYIPKYLEISKPPKDIMDLIEEKDREAKIAITSRKIDKMIKQMEVELDTGGKRIETMVSFYLENIDSLRTIGKRRGKNWRLIPKARDMLELSVKEGRDFEKRLNEELKNKGVINE